MANEIMGTANDGSQVGEFTLVQVLILNKLIDVSIGFVDSTVFSEFDIVVCHSETDQRKGDSGFPPRILTIRLAVLHVRPTQDAGSFGTKHTKQAAFNRSSVGRWMCAATAAEGENKDAISASVNRSPVRSPHDFRQRWLRS